MTMPFSVQSLIRPLGCTAIVGQRSVVQLSGWLMAQVLMNEPEAQVMCVDGANKFDPLTLARLSRAAGVVPQTWLRQVLVSRTYSGEQLISTLVDRAVPHVRQTAPNLLVGLGWLESLYDEDISEDKAHQWLQALIQSIQALKKSTHVVLFESAFLEVSGPRSSFIHSVLAQVDSVLNWTPDGRLYG